MWTRRALAPLLLTLALTPAIAQSFIVADVHPSPARLHPFTSGGEVHGDHYLLRQATMLELIERAYAVDPSSISGGPPWLDFDRFDIYAQAPASTSDDAAQLMLRSLLADRFKLVAHTDTKPLPAFILSAGKSPKLKPAAASDQPGSCDYQEPPKDASPAEQMSVKFSCHNETMQAFADLLRDAASPFLSHPLVEATGLKGAYDFDIQWTYRVPKGGEGVTIFTALDKQLGLKLDQKTAPLPVVAVESVNEKPTPNSPDLAKLLPPAPPVSFEVAVIRPSRPDEKNFSVDAEGSTVTISFATELRLTVFAYDIASGRIANKPAYFDQQHWDIVGKVSMGNAPPIPGAAPDLDIDDVKEMVRSLLADRFKLVTHPDTRLDDAYVLVAANPKIKKADPAEHTSCIQGPGPDGKDPRIANPLLSQLLYCQNMTMPQFAEELKTFASAYVGAEVIDNTGLTGGYDFTLSFSRRRDVRNAVAAPSSDDSLPSDPSNAISLYDAVEKQLGLKLVKKDKQPIPTLAIDHIDEKPTEN
jgi:uncharacterized protein (TIGR03435 family)